MLLRTSIGAALGCSLLLAACAGVPPLPDITGPTVTPSPNVQPTVDNVTAAIVAACGYEPSVATVANIIATFTGTLPVANLVETIAAGVCSAIHTQGAGANGGVRSYRGVVLHGHFVSRRHR